MNIQIPAPAPAAALAPPSPDTEMTALLPNYFLIINLALFGFVEDLELYADQTNAMLQARLMSRLGDSDLGVNARFLTALQQALPAEALRPL